MEQNTIGLNTRIYLALSQALAKFGLALPSGIHYIGGSDILPPPLPKNDERKAIEALERGDEQAKKTLIEHNLRLVVYIARRFENTGVGLEDLISIGTGTNICSQMFWEQTEMRFHVRWRMSRIK